LAREQRLRDSAAQIDDFNSETSHRVIDVITTRLLARIEQLIKDDPEARVCKEMLDQLGVRFRAAQEAIEALMTRTGLKGQ